MAAQVHHSPSMMTLPIFAAETPTSTASPASHGASTGSHSFSHLLQQIDTANTKPTSAASGHAESKARTPEQTALQDASRDAAQTASKYAAKNAPQIATQNATRSATQNATGDSAVPSKSGDAEKSTNLNHKVNSKSAPTRTARGGSSKPVADLAVALSATTPAITAIIPVPPQRLQDASTDASSKANLKSPTPMIPAVIAKALASNSRTSAVPSQEFAADPSSASIAASIASSGAHLAASVTGAEIIADLIPQQAQAAVSAAEALASRKTKLSTQTEVNHASADNSAAPVLAFSESGRTTHTAIRSSHPSSSNTPEDNAPATNSSAQSSHESRTASTHTRTGVAQSDASSSHASSTSATGAHDFVASTTTSAGSTAHSLLPSSLQPSLAQPDPAPGQAAAQSVVLQSAAAVQSATPAPSVLAPKPQGTTQTAPNAAAAGSQMLDSAQLHVGENSSQLKISVQLPELGKIEVRAVSAHDVTTAHLTAFRPEALPVLAESRAALEQALKSHDIVLGSLDSHASHSQAQGQAGGNPQQQSQHSPAASSVSTSAMADESVATSSKADLLPDYSSISVLA